MAEEKTGQPTIQDVERLTAENEFLKKQIGVYQDSTMIARIDLLLRIVESKRWEGTDFLQECMEEIERVMRLPEEVAKKLHEEVRR